MTNYFLDKFHRLKLSELLWLVAFANALAMIIGSSPYFFLDVSSIVRRQDTTTLTYPWVFIHVIFGNVWLTAGLLQFTDYFFSRRNLHRVLGYIYLTSSTISVFSLIVIQLKLGAQAPVSHTTLSIVIFTLISLVSAMFFIKQNNLELHRAWIMRSTVFAIAITLERFYALVFKYIIPGIYFYLIVFLIVELLIHRKAEVLVLNSSRNKYINYASALTVIFIVMSVFVGTTYFEILFVNSNLK